VALTLLCAGTLAARPRAGLMQVMTGHSVGAVMGRRLLAAAFTVPFALGWLPIITQQNGLTGTRYGIAALIAANAAAFAVVSFVAASSATRLETLGAAAEAAAQDSHDQLVALIDHTDAVIYMRDLDGRYMLINREFERLFDLRREKVLGLTDHDLFPLDIADEFRANDVAAVERGRPVHTEEDAPGEDGLHTYITVKFPIFTAGGQPYAVCGISTDLTPGNGPRRRYGGSTKISSCASGSEPPSWRHQPVSSTPSPTQSPTTCAPRCGRWTGSARCWSRTTRTCWARPARTAYGGYRPTPGGWPR
jgi:PAS domain S-box-containing protein